MAADSCHKQGMAKFSLALNFANGAVAPYLAKWGCAPSGHPAPRPSEMDTAGASPYAYDTPCWRIVCHRLPRRTSSDGSSAVLAPSTDSRAYKSARLLRCPLGPQMCPIDVRWGAMRPQTPAARGPAPLHSPLVGGAQAPTNVVIDYIVAR